VLCVCMLYVVRFDLIVLTGGEAPYEPACVVCLCVVCCAC